MSIENYIEAKYRELSNGDDNYKEYLGLYKDKGCDNHVF